MLHTFMSYHIYVALHSILHYISFSIYFNLIYSIFIILGMVCRGGHVAPSLFSPYETSQVRTYVRTLVSQYAVHCYFNWYLSTRCIFYLLCTVRTYCSSSLQISLISIILMYTPFFYFSLLSIPLTILLILTLVFSLFVFLFIFYLVLYYLLFFIILLLILRYYSPV